MKYARIVVNLVFLVLDVMNIKIPVSSHVKSGAIQEVGKFLWMHPVARMAIKTFIVAFKNAWRKHNPCEMATSILKLIKDLQAAGLLWMIFESVLSGMNKLQWLKFIAQVSANLTVMLYTGGWAFGAQIAGVLFSAQSLIDLILS